MEITGAGCKSAQKHAVMSKHRLSNNVGGVKHFWIGAALVEIGT